MMKKAAIFSCIFLCVIGLTLFITAKTSTAHAVARQAVIESKFISKSVGVASTVLLMSLSSKTGPTGKGCATLGYFAIGSGGTALVQVRLSIASYKEEWQVLGIMKDYAGTSEAQCTYG